MRRTHPRARDRSVRHMLHACSPAARAAELLGLGAAACHLIGVVLESFCRWPVDSPLLASSARTGAASELGRVVASAVAALSCLAIAATLATLSGKLKALGAARISLYFGAFFALTGALCLCDACGPWFSAPLAGDVLRAAAATALLPAAIALPGLLPRAAALARAARLAQERGRKLEAAHRDLDAAVARAKELETQLFANVGHELRTPLALILGPDRAAPRQPGPPPGAARRSGGRRAQRAHAGQARGRLAPRRQQRGGQAVGVVQRGRPGRAGAAPPARTSTASLPTGASPTPSTPRRDPGRGRRRQAPARAPQPALQRLQVHAHRAAACAAPRASSRATASLIEVADSGPGVPADEREAVFERFRHRRGRHHASLRRHGPGPRHRQGLRGADARRRSPSATRPRGAPCCASSYPPLAPPGAVVSSPEDSEVMLRAMVREALDGLREPSAPSAPAEAAVAAAIARWCWWSRTTPR